MHGFLGWFWWVLLVGSWGAMAGIFSGGVRVFIGIHSLEPNSFSNPDPPFLPKTF
jgi:hypothetical protein